MSSVTGKVNALDHVETYIHGEMNGMYSRAEVLELRESMHYCLGIAATHCAKKQVGGMEEWAKDNGGADLSCGWYHSTWSILRLMNMVAVPRWYPFYQDAIAQVLRRHPNAKVMISACADYGMLHTLHCAIKAARATPEIVIYDICSTPLRSCEWYAARHGFKVTCLTDNIITGQIPEGSYDLIVTDEFLSVLQDAYKPLIVERWKRSLKPGGTLVTTAMMGGVTTESLRESYFNCAKRRIEEFGHIVFPELLETAAGRVRIQHLVRSFADAHNRYMLREEGQGANLFREWCNVEICKVETPGECVNPTHSLQIVAQFSAG